MPPQPPQASWWKQLPTIGKVALIVVPILILCCGGGAAINAFGGTDTKEKSSASTIADPPAGNPVAGGTDTRTDGTGGIDPTDGSTATPTPTPTQTSAPSATTVTKTITETQSIPYSTKKVNDPTLTVGKTRVRTPGVNGVKTLTYKVTFANGTQTSKTLVSQKVTKQPVTKVIAVGTKPKSNCDPNYTPCVPIASDVDCAGGSGNGPAYVDGPVQVIGVDIYDLDRDGDGVGCD